MTQFYVETDRLRQGLSRLEPLAPALRSVRDELGRAEAGLRGLSCLDGCIASLRALSSRMEEQTGQAERLARVLEQSGMAYQQCEDRLSRQAEAQRR